MEISSELNINRLLKAKEYFLQNMFNYGSLVSIYKGQVARSELNYQVARASAKVDAMKDGHNATKAQAMSEASPEFISAKTEYANMIEKHEEFKKLHEYCAKRIDAIQQHISLISKEEQFNKHIKQ
jgi:hypothetical protein